MTQVLSHSISNAYLANNEPCSLNVDSFSEHRKIVDDTVTVLDKKTVNDTFNLARTSRRDPLDLIDSMLSSYIKLQADKAEILAKEISEKSKAIAEINRLWGLVMTESLPYTDPTKVDKTIAILDNTHNDPKIKEIDYIIKNTFNGPGISVITDNKNVVNYDVLQSINATMTAYCDTAQVDLDSLQQDFKNMMTELTSAQEEIRDIRRAVISFAER
ncbi:TPA: hypothetical protein ACQ301_004448 [Yersinia enterocolitica]